MRNGCQRLYKEGSISHELLGVSQQSRYQKVGHDLYNMNSQKKNFRQNLPFMFLVNYPNNNFFTCKVGFRLLGHKLCPCIIIAYKRRTKGFSIKFLVSHHFLVTAIIP